MTTKTASVIGSTGLVGGELVRLLLNDSDYTRTRILVRRPILLDHPQVEKKLVDFSDADSLLVALDGSDAVFVAVGTTQKKVKGDKEAYRKVDFDIPVNIARYCKMVGCRIFVLVSSIGANAKSRNFYLRLKGEVEDAIRDSGIDSVHVMRPSMLLGFRTESRPLEKIGQPIISAFSSLLPSRYKPIQASEVARAMVAASKRSKKGFFVYEYQDMQRLIRGEVE